MFPHGEGYRSSAELLILSVLRERPMYGYDIIRELTSRSEGYFAMEEGLLYPILHRLEREGLVQSEWRTAETRRRRRYYALSEAGLARAASAVVEWKGFILRVLRIVDPTGGGGYA